MLIDSTVGDVSVGVHDLIFKRDKHRLALNYKSKEIGYLVLGPTWEPAEMKDVAKDLKE